MIEHFQASRTEFEALLELVQTEESLRRIAPNFIRPADAIIDPERLADYRQRFEDLDLQAGVDSVPEKQQVWFLYHASGISVSGRSKGFLFSPSRPGDIRESLDEIAREVGGFYRKIDDDWYLFLLSD